MEDVDTFEHMEKMTGNTLKANEQIEPILQAPGAGLPVIEGMLLKYIVAPTLSAMTPWRLAVHLFLSEGYKALALAEKATHAKCDKRVLVPRLIAMEDSSRFWSVYMTLRHLILVGETIEDILLKSSKEELSHKTLSIVAVKPELETKADVLDDFRKFLERFSMNMGAIDSAHHSAIKHIHPWLGPINMHQWLCLGGIHQRLHRRQIQMILRGK